MIRLHIVADLVAEMDDNFVWSCEDSGFERLLNQETEIYLQNSLSPAAGAPRIAVMEAMARFIQADSTETDEEPDAEGNLVH